MLARTDKSVQVQIDLPEGLLSLNHILKHETAQVKTRKEQKETKHLSKLLLFKKVDISSSAEEGPQQLVRLNAVSETYGNATEEKHISEKDYNTKHPCLLLGDERNKLAIVRGSYLSLVEVPTFLSPSVTLGSIKPSTPLYNPVEAIEEQLARIRAKQCQPKMGKRSQWTVMCVALGFFTSCLGLVGGMLSITSDYQDRAIARMLNFSITRQPPE